MGKVKGIFAGEISGSVGKVTFRRTNGENVVAQKVSFVTNPRTETQQIQRMKMNTVIKAYSSLASICDHSFEGFSGKKANMSRFIHNNIGIFDISRTYGTPVNYLFASRGKDLNYAPNDYYISEGSLRNPVSLYFEEGTGVFLTKNGKKLVVSKEITVQEFHDFFNMQIGTQFSIIAVWNQSAERAFVNKSRFIYKPTSATSKMFLSNAQIDTSLLLDISDVNEDATLELVADAKAYNISVKSNRDTKSVAVILSKKENGIWRYSTERLCHCYGGGTLEDSFVFSWAFPSYSVGTNKYLNNATV